MFIGFAVFACDFYRAFTDFYMFFPSLSIVSPMFYSRKHVFAWVSLSFALIPLAFPQAAIPVYVMCIDFSIALAASRFCTVGLVFPMVSIES